MKRIASVILGTTLAAAPVFAQPESEDPGADAAADDGSSEEMQRSDEAYREPPPPPPPPPAPPPDAEPMAEDGPPPPACHRGNPDDRLVGIGTGYVLPADLDAFNTVSVRFRFGRLTIEPRADFSYQTISNDLGAAGSDDTKIGTLAVGAGGRFVLAESRGIELVALGSASISHGVVNPEGDENSTKQTTLGLRWGLGLDYWLSSRWVLSMSATNPFFEHSRTTREQLASEDLTDTETGIGVIWNPTVVGMVHLFF